MTAPEPLTPADWNLKDAGQRAFGETPEASAGRATPLGLAESFYLFPSNLGLDFVVHTDGGSVLVSSDWGRVDDLHRRLGKFLMWVEAMKACRLDPLNSLHRDEFTMANLFSGGG